MAEKRFETGEFRLSPIDKFKLDDGYSVTLCRLRQKFRLEKSVVFTRFSLEEIKERGLKVVKETFTSLFPRNAQKNKKRFRSLFADFRKWVAHEEPIIIYETARFFVHKKNPKRVIGVAFSVWAPDISDNRTTELWALRCLLQCNTRLLLITRLKRNLLNTPEEKITDKHINEMRGLTHWECIYERIVKMIDAMGKVANFMEAASSRLD